MKLLFGLSRFLFFALLILSIIAFSIWLYLNPLPHRQQLFMNGTVITMDDRNTIAEAVLVEEGRVLATGTDEAMDDLSSFDAVIIDLQGRTLLPGFIEAHGHFPGSDSQSDSSGIISALSDSIGKYLMQGVTTVQSGAASPQLFAPLTAFTMAGLVPQRVVFWPDENLAQQLEAGEMIGIDDGIDTEKITTNAVKLYVDDNPEQLNDRVAYWHNEGWQLAIHADDNADIDTALNALSEANRQHPINDRRHILIHTHTASEQQLERMHELGVTPSFFTALIYYSGDELYKKQSALKDLGAISPLKTAIEKDVRFSIHSNTPAAPIEPVNLVSYAVHRQTKAGRVLEADERISVLQALRATTIDAAWQIFREDDLGSIEPGKLADFVVLSKNPLENAATLNEIQVVQTWIGGVMRFDRTTER